MAARNGGIFAAAVVSAGVAISSFNPVQHDAASSLAAVQRKQSTVTTVECAPYNNKEREVGSPWTCRAEAHGHMPTGPLIFKSDRTSTLFDKECRDNARMQVCTITYKGDKEGKHTVTAIYLGNRMNARSSRSTHVVVNATINVTTKKTVETAPQDPTTNPEPSVITPTAVIPVDIQPAPSINPGPGLSTLPANVTAPPPTTTTTQPPVTTTTTQPPTTTTTTQPPVTTTTTQPPVTTTTTQPPTTTTTQPPVTTIPQNSTPAAYYSYNWSGYMAYSNASSPQPSVTSVSANWVVQSINTSGNSSTAAAVQWIGIGGILNGDQTLIQIGTGWNSAGFSNSNFAWYEMLPGFMLPIPSVTVVPGDIMSASVSLDKGTQNLWTLMLSNNTLNQTFKTTVTYAASQLSAEVIDEAPGACTGTQVGTSNCTEVPLADFGTASFSGAAATINGGAGSLGSFPYASITMVNSASQQISIPSALVSEGDFTVNWQQSATGSVSQSAQGTGSETHSLRSAIRQ